MGKFLQQTPDGRTIAAEPDLRRHVAQPPPRHPATVGIDTGAGSVLLAFVSSCVAALPELPRASGPRICLQLFLIGAGEAFWAKHRLPVSGITHVLTQLLERHGLSGTETTALIEALPQLRLDLDAVRLLDQGAQAMEAFLINRDNNIALQMQERTAEWRRERLCQD
jgi:hypothetical protein